MGLTASDSGGGNFKRMPAGAHIARCFSVADLGTHTTNGQYGEKTNRKIRIAWEVFGDDENDQQLTVELDGKTMPLTINKTYTLSLAEKAALRKDLSAWRGRDFNVEELKAFDVTSILGAYCMLNVTISESNGKTYANVAGISPLHKTMAKPAPAHANQLFDLDSPDMAVFNAFYEGLQDYIMESPEWKAHNNAEHGNPPRNVGADFDDDITS